MAAEMSTAAAAAEALPPPNAAVDDAAQSLAQGDGSDGGSSARPLATDCCSDTVTDENTPYELPSFEVVAPQPPSDPGSDSTAGFDKYLVWLLVAGIALLLAAFVIIVVWVRKRRATKLLIKNGPAGHGCAERGEGTAATDDDDSEQKTADGHPGPLLGKTPPTRSASAARSAKGDLGLDADIQARARSGGDDTVAAEVTFVVGTDIGGAGAMTGARLAGASATPDIVVGHLTDGGAEEVAGGRGGSRARSTAAGDGAASATSPASNVALLLPLPPQSAAGAATTTVASDGDDLDAAGRRMGVPSRHRSAASRRTSGARSSAPRTPSVAPTSDVTEMAFAAAAAEPAVTSAGRSSRVARAATATETAAAASRGTGSTLDIQAPDPRSPAALSPDLLQTTTLTASNHTLLSDDTYYGRRKLLTPRTASKMVSELIARNRMREKLEKQERIRNFAQRQSDERTKMRLQNWSDDEEEDCESNHHGFELESDVAPSSGGTAY